MKENPFRISGIVTGKYFIDRTNECQAVIETMRGQGEKMLIYGERRMGKSSILLNAAARMRKEKEQVVYADISPATSLTDVANIILHAFNKETGGTVNWIELLRQIQLSFTISSQGIPSLDVSLKKESTDKQLTCLSAVLDSLDAYAVKKKLTLIIDEFQKMVEFGAEAGEWQLRSTIQQHQHLNHIYAGSQTRIINQMLMKDRAFYRFFEILSVGPIDEVFMADWIDERFKQAFGKPYSAGSDCIRLAGPRTRDIVKLARKTFALAQGSQKTKGLTADAIEQLVSEEDDFLRPQWDHLSNLQKDILKVIASGVTEISSQATISRFGLPNSSKLAYHFNTLVKSDVLGKNLNGYHFDNPFFKQWVTQTLSEV
ncbi:MAG: ATP-binding protein [Opitutae bacterium]|nr:ATP-binding protein [Opitutae bacterium]MDG1300756.1 ATP-binding protein [Opitutae bacterium]